MLSKNFVLGKLTNLLRGNKALSEYRIGLAGSVARGTFSAVSDIDIVVDALDMPFDLIELLKSSFSESVEVIFLGVLEADDKELDSFLESENLPINDESAYKTIKGRLFGLNKSLSRDMSILYYILRNQNKIQNVIKDFNCDFSQTR